MRNIYNAEILILTIPFASSTSPRRVAYNEFRERLPEFTKYENMVVAWGFETEVVFLHFERYRTRLFTIVEILQSARDYYRLEKIEIGGLRGRSLGQRLGGIFKEFQAEYEKWSTIKFNPLDPEINKSQFEGQFREYQSFCDIFERKLATTFLQALFQCNNFDEAIKLIEMIGQLLKRPLIFKELQAQANHLIDLYSWDIDFAAREFQRGVEGYKQAGLAGIPKDNDAFPPVSGTLMWIRALQGQIAEPIKDVDIIDFP